MDGRIITTAAICIVSAGLFANEALFRDLGSTDGLSQSNVWAILQDSRGFLWIGTQDGLNVYDGYRVRTYYANDSDSLSLNNNYIRCLAEDHRGNIWIGTNDGISVYNSRLDYFYSLPSLTPGSKETVFSLYADGDLLWIGTRTHLFLSHLPELTRSTNPDSLKWKSLRNISSELGEKPRLAGPIHCIFKDSRQVVWVGGIEGIARIECKGATGDSLSLLENNNALERIVRVQSIAEDLYRNIWIGSSSHGLYRSKNLEVRRFYQENQDNQISRHTNKVAVDSSGNLWVGTFSDGIMRIDKDQLNQRDPTYTHFYNNTLEEGKLSTNLIRCISVSKKGVVWIGTEGRGVYSFNPNRKPFQSLRIPRFNNKEFVSHKVLSIYKAPSGYTYLGMHLNGLLALDPEGGPPAKLGFEDQSVFRILPLGGQDFLIGSSYGSYLITIRDGQIVNQTMINFGEIPFQYSYKSTYDICASSDHIFWMATTSGLFRVDLSKGTEAVAVRYHEDSNPSISANKVLSIRFDSARNLLWAGTEGGGLNCLTLDENKYPTRTEVYLWKSSPSDIPVNNDVGCLLIDDHHRIWAGTSQGLYILSGITGTERPSIKRLSSRDGLPNHWIRSIARDADGLIWIATNRGLTRYDIRSNIFTNYNSGDGLQANEFSENALFQTTHDTLYFGGVNGVTYFHPQSIKPDTLVPKVILTEFRLFDKEIRPGMKVDNRVLLSSSITHTDSIFLRAGENDLTIGFTSFPFANSLKTRYAYMLEGYDKSWKVTTVPDHFATYTNLRHGNYAFKVKSSSVDGNWDQNFTELFIKIQAPFYLTYWAFFLYTAMAVFLIIYFTHYSIIKITTKKELILKNEHNQKLNQLNETRTRFFINVSHDLRTPVTLIKGPIENALRNEKLDKELKDQLDIAGRNASKLNDLVEQLLDIRRMESKGIELLPAPTELIGFVRNEVAHFQFAFDEKGVSFHYLHDVQQIETCIDRKIVSKIVLNLLSNALKYSGEGDITLRVEPTEFSKYPQIQEEASHHMLICIEIQDNGPGIPKEKLQNIFDRFYSSGYPTDSGHGIGLSHTRAMVTAHRGHIEVQSEEGSGTVFRILIPGFYPQEQAGLETHSSSCGTKAVEGPQEKPTDLRKESGSREKMAEYKVLLIDDNPDMISYLRFNLKDRFVLLEALNGKVGLKLAGEHSPDVIICDVMMPEMDGLSFCEMIKNNMDTSHIPIILLTAKTDKKTRYTGIKTGADDYISKPFDPEYLSARILNLIESRERQRMHFQKNLLLEPAEVAATSADEAFLSKLMKLINENISEPDFNVESLEESIGMSHANFYRKLKKLTGFSGKELLNELRMKRAEQLICQKKFRVSEIAYMVGFTDPRYFSKCFKEKFGAPPNKYTKLDE